MSNMTFYAVKETNHRAIFNTRTAAETFITSLKSVNSIFINDDIEQIYKDLNWKKFDTKVFISKKSQTPAIFENEEDAKKNSNAKFCKKKKFKGPLYASVDLGWEYIDQYSKIETLGKSKVYTELFEYTLSSCKHLFKIPGYNIIFTIIFFTYLISDLLSCTSTLIGFPSWLMKLSYSFLLVTFLILLGYLYLIKKKSYSIFIDYRIVSKINNKISKKIKSYNLNALSLNELINETDETQKSSDFKLLLINLAISIIPSIISPYFSKNSNFSYLFTNGILLLPIFIVVGEAFRLLYKNQNLYFRKTSSIKLLLKQELKNALIEENSEK